MAQPLSRSLHIDNFLTNISVGWSNNTYIADGILPIVPVTKQSDIVPTFTQSAWFRDEARIRAIGTESQGSGWGVDNTNIYFCNRFSTRREIPDELRDNADAPWNLDLESVEWVTDKLALRRELAFAQTKFIPGVWGTNVAAPANFTIWSDLANSNPLIDLTTYSDAIEGSIGRWPTTLVLGKAVWSVLKWHPDLVDTIKYTTRGIPGPDLLTEALELQKLLIGRAIYTASPEGTAESAVTYSRVWGKSALLLYVPDRPSLMTPAAGYTFTWMRVSSALQYIKRIRDEPREVDIIEANGYWDQRVTAAKAGVFMDTLVA